MGDFFKDKFVGEGFISQIPLSVPAMEQDTFVDMDEIPWQIIGIMDEDMLRNLQYYKQ